MSERVLIVPVATKEWWAGIVRWFLRSKFNHIFVMFEDTTLGGWWAVDIKPEGVIIIPAENSSLKMMKYAEFYECTESMVSTLQAFRHIIGAGYDWKGLAWNIFRIGLWRLLKVRWLKPRHDSDRVTCSEGAMELIRLKPISGAGKIEPSTAMPQDVRDFMLYHTKFITVDNPLEEGE